MSSRPTVPTPAAGSATAAAALRYDPKPQGSWKKLIGRAKDDALSLEAFRRGAEWREQMNQEGK